MKTNLLRHITGNEEAKLALSLMAINPKCGGLVISGRTGTGKSLLAHALKYLLSPGDALIKVPLHATEDTLRGGFDFECFFKTGEVKYSRGILERAAGGFILVDDLHLLSPPLVHLLMHALDEKTVSLIATADSTYGPIPKGLLERVGLHVHLDGGMDHEKKLQVMFQSLFSHATDSEAGRNYIWEARRRLTQVTVTEEIMEMIAQKVLSAGENSHRRDLFLLEAARAYAAFMNEREILPSHVKVVAPFVLIHEPPVPSSANAPSRKPLPPQGKEPQGSLSDLKKAGKEEEVFEIGQTFEVKPLTFLPDRIRRFTIGRRTDTRTKRKGGRGIGTSLVGKNDVAWGATIRAAAPKQAIRGLSTEGLIIKEEDLRFWRRARKTKHVVIFVTDASGSMGVNRRMVETKGAIMSLLDDCYKHRDQVAMITFRGDDASVILPPTSSVTMAARRLKEMPVGGKTPLSKGMVVTSTLVATCARRWPEARFAVILITDGRANRSLSGNPVMSEIRQITQKMRELPHTDFIVVDTEDKTSLLKTDRAKIIASLLGARYLVMADLRASKLAHLARSIRP